MKVSADYNGRFERVLNFGGFNCTNSDDADVQVYKQIQGGTFLQSTQRQQHHRVRQKISEDNLVKFFNIVLNE
jgi:hypothetical protein